MKVLATALLSLLLHLLLGWAWTIAAGVAGGFWAGSLRRGWWVGAAGVLLGWMVPVIYSYAVAGPATARMTSEMGQILGNMPGMAFVGLSLLIGLLLGLVGGLAGAQAALLFRRGHAYAHGSTNA